MHGFPEWFILLLMPETWFIGIAVLVVLAVVLVTKIRKK